MICIQCGNCCRIGGPCDLLMWRSVEHRDNRDCEFEGTCPELMDDGRCGVAVKAYGGQLNLHDQAIPFLDDFFARDCSRPDLRAANAAKE